MIWIFQVLIYARVLPNKNGLLEPPPFEGPTDQDIQEKIQRIDKLIQFASEGLIGDPEYVKFINFAHEAMLTHINQIPDSSLVATIEEVEREKAITDYVAAIRPGPRDWVITKKVINAMQILKNEATTAMISRKVMEEIVTRHQSDSIGLKNELKVDKRIEISETKKDRELNEHNTKKQNVEIYKGMRHLFNQHKLTLGRQKYEGYRAFDGRAVFVR
eukprot:NODE_299_length_10456_cov_1.003669.p6 type:complete len:217 gc:universal NODE_299_length_10456_cov_1.003669:4408-3758(-)